MESFLDSHFELRRHECANAAMRVFGLTHERSRRLYDLTLLEIRRVLYSESNHPSVNHTQLGRSKSARLLRYSNFLTGEEFKKFVALMRDLAPSVVVAVKPANEPLIRKGQWPAIRENLVLVLEGDPLSHVGDPVYLTGTQGRSLFQRGGNKIK